MVLQARGDSEETGLVDDLNLFHRVVGVSDPHDGPWPDDLTPDVRNRSETWKRLNIDCKDRSGQGNAETFAKYRVYTHFRLLQAGDIT